MNKIQIVADDERVESSVRRYLEQTLNGLAELDMEDVVLIYVNSIFSSNQKRSENMGLRVAQDLVKDESKIIILAGFESAKQLQKRDKLFAILLAYPNVEYIDILNLKEIIPAYYKISTGKKKLNKTVIELYDFHEWERQLAILKHVVRRTETSPQDLQDWLEDAKKAGLTGTNEEIISYVKNWTPGSESKFAGKHLEGIFVDAYETLFDADWKLLPEVKQEVESLSRKLSKSVFVISDSERAMLEKKLDENNINWPLISKFDIRGASLELVIDNLTQTEFQSSYNIKAQKFIQVEELKKS